ncbi:hypothetical protein ACLX1H_005508 [Fusarium chlamydosporum]
MSAQAPSQPPDVSYAAQTDRRTQYYADLAKFQAQAEQAKADAAKEQAVLQAQFQAQMDQAKIHTQQLETQWRDAERLAAQYKADYQAQMKIAEEEMTKLKIDEDKQRDELERLRAEEAKNLKLGEEELVREQQRLFDEIQRQRQLREEEEVRPPLPPRVSTEDVAPPLPKRPVSTAGSVSSARTGSYRETPVERRQSYLSPQSPQVFVPPPPPGPPPSKQTTGESQRRGSGNSASATTSPGQAPQQQVPYYPPPPSSPQTRPSPKVEEQAQTDSERGSNPSSSPTTVPRPHKLRNSFHAPSPSSPSSTQPSPRQQQQPEPSYPPAPPVQSPPQQRSPPSTTQKLKAPRVRTPEPVKLHSCGAKAGAECSGALTAFPQHWFYHAAVPEFVICARCYIDHIYDTTFSNSFRKVYYDDGEKSRCRFSSRRIKDTLFPAAVKSGSLDQLLEFMQRRMTINDCREQNAVEGEMWYRAADIPEGTICQACFEDGLITSSFAKYYSLQGSQGGAYCDLSVWFLKRKFMDYAKEDKWNDFCRQFNERAQLPECPKINTVNASQYTWYKPISGPEGLQACGACYHDYFYASEDEDKWQQVRGGNFDTRCSLGQVNCVIPMHQALDDEDRSVFWSAVREMDKYPFCNREGIKGGTWYTPINDPPNWGICAACYEGIVKPVGGSRWFMKDTGLAPDGVYLCGFNLGHPRALQALQTYANARNWGEPRILLDWTTQMGSIPQCPRIKFSKNRRWWGWGVAAICEDCYFSFAKGTALEPRFALTGQREPDKERMCDLFSPRMRSLYNEACTTGNLETFLALAEQRHMIYTQTIMQCEQILNEQKMAAMQAQMLGMQGTVYKSMGWTQE